MTHEPQYCKIKDGQEAAGKHHEHRYGPAHDDTDRYADQRRPSHVAPDPSPDAPSGRRGRRFKILAPDIVKALVGLNSETLTRTSICPKGGEVAKRNQAGTSAPSAPSSGYSSSSTRRMRDELSVPALPVAPSNCQ